MSQNNQPVKIDITSSFDSKGTTEAKREIDSLTATVNKSGQAAQEVAQHSGEMRLAVMGVSSAAAGAALAVAAYAAYQLKLAAAQVELSESMVRMSERTGISIQELGQMNAVALTNDTTMERLAMAYKNLSVKQLEANSGNQNAISLFKALGVEYEDGTGKLRNARDVMDDVATKFAGMENGAGKNAVAAKLLGRGLGEELIPYLNQGADGLKRMRDEADKLGIKIDEDTARNVKELKDNMKLLELSAQSAAGAIAGPLIKALADAAAEMIRVKKEGAGMFATLWAGFNAGVGSAVMNTDQDNLNRMLEQKSASLAAISDAQKKLGNSDLPARERKRLGDLIKNANASINEMQTGSGGIEELAKRISDAKPLAVAKLSAPDMLEKPEKAGRAGRSAVDHEANAIAALRRQLMRREGASMQEQVQQDIEDGQYKGFSKAGQQTLLNLAKEEDLRRRNADAMKSEIAAAEARDKEIEDRAKLAFDHATKSVEMRRGFANEAERIDAQLSYDKQRILMTEFDQEKEQRKRQFQFLLLDSEERKSLEEQYARRVVARHAQITEELKPEWQKMVDAYGDTARSMKDFNERFIGGGLKAGENAFVEWARTGKVSIKDLFGTLRDEIARTIYQQQIAKPAAGLLSSLASSVGNLLFGGGGHAQNLGAVAGAFPQEHSGGIVGGPAVMRHLPLSVFNNARRMHRGGIASNEVPTILEKGEEVLTRADPRHRRNGGSMPAVMINVINQSGQPMEAQASAPRFDGEQMIVDVFLKRMSRDAGMRDGMRSMLASPV
jgi:hypothetical protein